MSDINSWTRSSSVRLAENLSSDYSYTATEKCKIIVGMRTTGQNSQINVLINGIMVFRCFPEVDSNIFTTNSFDLNAGDTIKLAIFYGALIKTVDKYSY